MIYVIGGRGRLAQAIAAEYSDSVTVSLARAIYEGWSQVDSCDNVSRYFDDKVKPGSVVFVAAGLLDPGLPKEDLLRVNFLLPKNIIECAAKLGIKVVTFGSVMEDLFKSKNPYIQTKTLLGEYVADVASLYNQVIHLRIHTLYGLGEPSPFMFLGQMLSAIRNNIQFDMTLGKQLREYHHVKDEVKAIRKIADMAPPGVIALSHGQPNCLKDIAENVFHSFGRDDLLRIGALPEPAEENYERIFIRPEILNGMEFRDPLPAIVEYMKESYVRIGLGNNNETGA